MKLLALDLGERRIGLAVGDTSTTLVFPAGHLSRSRLSDDLDKILETSGERRIEGIVVGMPYSLDGTPRNAGQTSQRIHQRPAKADLHPHLHYR